MGWPANLLATAQSGNWAKAYLWKIHRVDGVVLGFTDIDIDLDYDNGDGDGVVTYKASSGFTATQIKKSSDGSVDNLSVQGLFGSVTLEDLLKSEIYEGRFYNAVLKIMVVNFEDLTEGDYQPFKGTLGNIVDKGNYFECELISDYKKLMQPIGRVIQPLCDAVFADSRCGLNEATFTFAGVITGVTSNSIFADVTTPAIANKADDYFGAGKLIWTSGNNNGLVGWVKSFITDTFTMYKAFPNTVQVGDGFNAVAGCRKRAAEDCDTKFSNLVNHRGFPGVPGDKFILSVAEDG